MEFRDLKVTPAVSALQSRDASALVEVVEAKGEVTLYIVPEKIVDVCRYLKYEHGFNRLVSVTCVDWYPQDPRFEIIYHLYALGRNERLRLKCRVAEPFEIDSITSVWQAANWYEREVYDLFGVTFRNHPDLRRIMMPDEWHGHPLRKDYPVHGHKYDYQDE